MVDLTGQRFGRLVAIRPTEERYRKTTVVWECRCDCGKIKRVPATLLRNGTVKSCGCLGAGSRLRDITGEKRGKLTALYPTGAIRSGYRVWAWRCECGNIVEKSANSVKWGGSTMCPACSRTLKCQQAEEAVKHIRVDSTGRKVQQVQDILAGKPLSNSTSGVRGVTWHARQKKWQVRVQINGKTQNIGYYASLEDAKAAREKAVKEIYAYALEESEKSE